MARFKVREHRRGVVIGGAVAVVVIAGGLVALSSGSKPAAAAQTATAQLSTVEQSISASGTLQPAQQADLTFPVAGQVSSVSAVVGQQVTAGESLATIDAPSLPVQVAQAQATVATDEAKVAADGSSGSSAQLASDQAALTAAQGQLTAAQNAQSESTMTSPIDGTVGAVNLAVGQSVTGTSSSGSNSSAGGSAGSGGSTAGGKSGSSSSSAGSAASRGTSSSSSTAQIVVISTGSFTVAATVDDTEIGQVAAGQQAVITPDGATTPVYGLVSSVGIISSSSSGVASFPVSIAITGTPGGLYDGASATVQIITKKLSNVLTVPRSAVHSVNGKSVVYVAGSKGGQVTKTVTPGMSSGNKIQIVSGLDAGAKVVLPATVQGAATSSSGTRSGRSGLGGGGLGGGGNFGGGGGRNGAGSGGG